MRKPWHGQLANRILAMGDTLKLEQVSYKAWQKMFGRSIQFRAPGSFVSMLRRKAESAGGIVDEFPTRTTKLSQVCICGSIEKKSLSQRWHKCSCGVLMQRDLFSAFLAKCVEDGRLSASLAISQWPGLETSLWAALGKTKLASANGKALPSSLGLDRGVCLPNMLEDGAGRPESLPEVFAKSHAILNIALATAKAEAEPHIL